MKPTETIGLVMSSPPVDVPLSPVSIHGLPALESLRWQCEQDGYRFVERVQPADAEDLTLALWDFGSVTIPPRWLKETTRRVAWSLESPLVAHRAYHRLPTIAATSDWVLGYPGVESLIGSGQRFSSLHWPNAPRKDDPPGEWPHRRFAVMINSQKSVSTFRTHLSVRDPYRSARRLAAAALARSYRLRRTWEAPDLYRERLRMIRVFAEHDGFDLWGVGWDRPIPSATREVDRAVTASYRGSCSDKHETLSRYRFALCVENTRFPGYISEKIFDAFLAGSIPVYRGAPDVKEYIPGAAFVDADDFVDRSALLTHLTRMSDTEAQQKLTAARSFLRSPEFSRFSEESFVSTFSDAIHSVMRLGAAGGREQRSDPQAPV